MFTSHPLKKSLSILGISAGIFQAYASDFEEPTAEKVHFKTCQEKKPKTAQKPQPKTVSEEKELNSRLEIGGSYTRAHIAILGGPSFNGDLGGALGLYEWCPKNNFYGALRVDWKQGMTKSSLANRWLLYVDVQERLGYTYAIQNWTASFFTGLGYRYLGHKLGVADTHIKFEYNELYVPLGIASDYQFTSWFAAGLNFTWMPQVYPTVKILPLNGAFWSLDNSLNNFRAELPFTFEIPATNKHFSIMFKPFYEYWEDGKSTAATKSKLVLGLPGNTYNFWGAELNFGYAF